MPVVAASIYKADAVLYLNIAFSRHDVSFLLCQNYSLFGCACRLFVTVSFTSVESSSESFYKHHECNLLILVFATDAGEISLWKPHSIKCTLKQSLSQLKTILSHCCVIFSKSLCVAVFTHLTT